jgi:hypothetical protein
MERDEKETRRYTVMRKENVVHSIAAVVLLTCLLFSSAFASIQVKEMAFSFENLKYYSNQALSFSQGTFIVADVGIAAGSGVSYDYTITNAVVTLGTMPLTGGYGTNSGTFSSPATLTVTGNLIKNATSTDLTGNVTLLTAQMDSATMVISQVFSKYASGDAMFSPIGGALFAGVDDGAEKIVLQPFSMGFWAWGTTVLFADNTMTAPEAGIQISVPEPLSITLLAVGMLAVSRKRKIN